MATVTTRPRSWNLTESHRRVRSPLHRLCGYIRAYVAAEGLATLGLFLALWYWIGLVMDYGVFKVFTHDWVQAVPQFVRALAMGIFFVGVAALIRLSLLYRTLGDEVSDLFHESYGTTPRQLMPFWMKLAVGWLAIGVVAGVAYLGNWLFDWSVNSQFLKTVVVAAPPVAIFLVALLYLGLPSGLARVFKTTPILIWVRMGLGIVGLIGGGIAGVILGPKLVSSEAVWMVGAGVGATIGGTAAWMLLGSMLYMLVEKKSYRLIVTLPLVGLYLAGWALVGWWAQLGLAPALTGLLVFCLLAGPAVAVVVKRLLYDFRDRSLALVLERRFPDILGDRLITAVELSNPREASKLGYSPVMVEETIHEAAARVEQLPLKEVFDWRRLWVLGMVVVALIVGGYVLAGSSFVAADAITGSHDGPGGFHRYHDVAAIWGERNLLLENTIWPRRAHLEFVGAFGDDDEVKIGRDGTPPTVRVRALKWVIADRKASEGWRALYWKDLMTNPDLLGGPVPSAEPPADWAQRHPDEGVSMDEIELRLEKKETHKTLSGDTEVALRDVLAKLEERVQASSMSRKVRKLEIPESVFINYTGEDTRSEMPLDALPNNEFEARFPELKVSIKFRARGEDYYSGDKRVTVVPPPGLESLECDQYQPAYLFYRVRWTEGPDGKPVNALAGKKQFIQGLSVTLHGGEMARVDLPAGSDIVLRATSDKELQANGVRILSFDDKKPMPGASATVFKDEEDGRLTKFETRFNNVRSELRLTLEFLDTDNVIGRRDVTIKPMEDLPPDVDVDVNPALALLKTKEGYLVTPRAEIVTSGKDVRDDHGLAGMQYVYIVTAPQSPRQGSKAADVASVLSLLAGGPGRDVLAAACLPALAKEQKVQGAIQGKVIIKAFADKINGLGREFIVPDENGQFPILDQPLSQDQRDRRVLLKVKTMDGEDPDYSFDLDADNVVARDRHPGQARLPKSLKAPAGQGQPRYRLVLKLEAWDTNVDTGPRYGQSKERMDFVIVSEEELLTEIGKQEEKQRLKFEDTLRGLHDGESKITQLRSDLGVDKVKPEQFGAMAARVEDMSQVLDKHQTSISEILEVYKNIQRCMELNRVRQALIDKVSVSIVGQLKESIDTDFPEVDKALKDLRKTLDSEVADSEEKTKDSRRNAEVVSEKFAALLARLENVLNAMEKLTDINSLIALLYQMQKDQMEADARYNQIKKEIDDRDLEAIQEKPNEKKPDDKKPEDKKPEDKKP
jgi:hypothetical protein